VFIRFISITMIIFLLVAQAGEAFAVFSMACFNHDRKMVMSEDAVHSGEHAAVGNMHAEKNHVMDMNDDVFSQTSVKKEMNEHECCQQDCDCPAGMLSLAVLVELNIQVISHLTDEQKIDTERRLVHAFIPGQKRPPKSPISFAV
jgi:hypothetical protein